MQSSTNLKRDTTQQSQQCFNKVKIKKHKITTLQKTNGTEA